MSIEVIVGAQWGDEGKGKVVDALAERADVVARFGGGANAGHTLVVSGKKTIIRLVPSGILQPRPLCVLGAGMVIDPTVLRAELTALEAAGIDTSARRVLISEQAHVVLPYHMEVDRLREAGSDAIGTTKRGIGPAYEDKVGRRGVRMADLLDEEAARARIMTAIANWAPTIARLGGTVPEPEPIILAALEHGRALAPLVGDATGRLQDAVARGERVVAEGAQGSLLDIDHGTYPFVTSSTVLASGAASGLGVGPTAISRVIGITKAYTTRVGAGPFPTEIDGAIGDRIRQRGGEFGSVTGRPRRCGWLDLVALRHAVRLNGVTELAMTKIDVLEGLDTIRVCVGYRLDGHEVSHLPSRRLGEAEPIYVEVEGFHTSLASCRTLAALPDAVRRIVALTEERTGARIRTLGVGPDRLESVDLG